MQHIKDFSKILLLVLVLFVAGSHLTFNVLKAWLSDTDFRLIVAANAEKYSWSNDGVLLFLGNSRIMGGISTVLINDGYKTSRAYNLAYNGLDLNAVKLLYDAFKINCKCKIDSVYINPDIYLADESQSEVTDIEKFITGFDKAAFDLIRSKDEKQAFIMRLFPLLHFNNEFFFRAMYYRIFSLSDQAYSNNYNFKVTEGVKERLRNMNLNTTYNLDAAKKLYMDLSSDGAKVILIQPPLHPAYIKNVAGMPRLYEAINTLANVAADQYVNYTDLFQSNPEYFSDPLHLNKEGQLEFTALIEKMF